ncbi:MAG: 16S rRNA (guanine(527)-N(7))-methyltransferase RsmG [Candidatus Eremiobacteraeota bacterium]|nr:16S rRNA (guanine(527)-N(7))-methyltransferase RsmG [Candidatus Eremiobacteraeota bacterium]
MTEQDELESLLESSGIAERRPSLARYGALILAANRRFNLTGAKNVKEIAEHLTDSLTAAPFIEGALVDVGSGAGLPAIPIAIVTGAPITLVECTLKKVRFLQEAIERFGLHGCVVAARAETAAHDASLREKFRSGTARAVATAPAVAELLLPFIESGGAALLQRGTCDLIERNALEDAAGMLGGAVERYIEIDRAHDRTIAVVRKITQTPGRFPRRVGIPQKRPLCV